MIETIVDSIRVNLVTQSRVVFLKEVSGNRHLPIWIGEFEAMAIANELQGRASPRPLPYDVIKSLVGDLNGRVDRVVVSDLSQDVFYARIFVDVAGRMIEVDSRPSDAIALAVRVHCPILVEDSVMAKAGVSGDDTDDDDDSSEAIGDRAETTPALEGDQLSVFRDFINTLDFEDFEKRRGG